MTTLAAIDRVVHHSVILDLTSMDSYRAQAATTRQTASLPPLDVPVPARTEGEGMIEPSAAPPVRNASRDGSSPERPVPDLRAVHRALERPRPLAQRRAASGRSASATPHSRTWRKDSSAKPCAAERP